MNSAKTKKQNPIHCSVLGFAKTALSTLAISDVVLIAFIAYAAIQYFTK